MARTKQQPNKYGIRQTETGPARRLPQRGARGDGSSLHTADTRLRRRATAAAAKTTAQEAQEAQEELAAEVVEMLQERRADISIEASGSSSLFPPLELEPALPVEGSWGLMSEEERSGVMSADSPEKEAVQYEFEFDRGEQPPKRRRVAQSTSPKASRGQGAAAKGRRKSIANVVQTMSDAMAKAQSSHGVKAPLRTEGGEADAEGEEELAVAEDQPNGETQQADVLEVADPGEEEAAAPEAPGPDPNGTDIEDDGGGRQGQQGPLQTSQETRVTNGTGSGSAYAVSEASETGYVPAPQTNLPPRKSAANPTTNIPPEARLAAQPLAQPNKKLATNSTVVSSAGAPQEVKRKRGRPRKLVEPIVEPIAEATAESTAEPTAAQPERAAKKISDQPERRLPQTRTAAQNVHPPPTQTTASSLMPSAPSVPPLPPVPPRGQSVRAVPEGDRASESDGSDTAQDTGPAEALKVVEFPTGTVTSIVALMSSSGWTGQSMWKGTSYWFYGEGYSLALTKEANELLLQLEKLQCEYSFTTPKLGSSSFALSPSVVKTLRKQTYYLTRVCSSTASKVEVSLFGLCDMLIDPFTTDVYGETRAPRAPNKDAVTARRTRAIMAEDVVSYVIPHIVCVLEAACCLGGSKPNKELAEQDYSVPLDSVRITIHVWRLINEATYWLVKLETALAHELGYRGDRDSTAMGLGMAEREAGNPWLFLAGHREKRNDRAQLKVLLNRLQDELCHARIRLERAENVSNVDASEQPQQPQQPQQPLIDPTQDTTTPAQPALPAAESMEVDNWGVGDQFESYNDSSAWLPRLPTAAAKSVSDKADKAAPAPAPAAQRQVAKRSYQLSSLDFEDLDEESMADVTIGALSNANGRKDQPLNASAAGHSRAESIEIVLSTQRPTPAVPAAADVCGPSPEADDAMVEDVIEVAKDEAAEAADAIEAADAVDAVQDAVEDVVVEQNVAEEREMASAAAAEKEKTGAPDKNSDEEDEEEEEQGEPMMTRAIPPTANASSATANSDAGSEESSIFLNSRVEVQEQQVAAPASVPAPATPAPRSTAAAKPAEASQDDSFAPAQYTRAELKTILSILRTKGAALDLGQLAAELGRDVLDVANRVESIKAAARAAALREKKPIQPWACAGFRLNH